MSKFDIKLSLKDLYAIKHGLEKQLEFKNTAFMLIETSPVEVKEQNIDQYNKLDEDIRHEEGLLLRLKEEIKEIEKFIKRQ